MIITYKTHSLNDKELEDKTNSMYICAHNLSNHWDEAC